MVTVSHDDQWAITTSTDKESNLVDRARSLRLTPFQADGRGILQVWESAARMLEAGLPVKYGCVFTQTTIPYARHLEDQILPSVVRICTTA